ncbi:hypothetical protein AYI69_g3077, partial [Smittium culicis]
MSSETVISEAVIASILNAINDLTSKVDNLTVGKPDEPSLEDDQHISASIPATVLNVYQELESLIPSMSEDFYRTMLTDEEKKEAIYGCPKSSKVDNLTVGKPDEPSLEDDQHISASIPATVLNVYQELESLIPSMSEDFYRTMLTDEEKKEAIYGCPKSSKVCYNPPPINEAAPGSVKKADAALYAIQVALAHGARPIDYFIHRMPQSNSNLTLDDPVVGVLNTIRCIIENTASMAAQARLVNLHSGMSFTVKPEQVVETEVKPLMDSEKFDTQIAAIKPNKRARVRRPFRGRQQIEGRPRTVSFITATAPITEAAATRPAPNSSRGGGGRESEPRILQQFILHPKEDRRTTPSIGSKEAEPAPGGKEPQDGIPSINLQDNQEKGLYYVLGFEERIPAYFDTQVVESYTLDDHRQPGHVLESYNVKDSRPTARTRETDKRRKDVAQRPSELYRKGTSDVSGAPTGKINAAPTVGAEETILVVERVMEIDGLPIRRNNTESNVLEGPFEEMKWSVVPAGTPRSRGIHRFERYGLGYRHWPQELLWLMEKIRGYTPHKLQGAACSSNCLATERNRGPVSSDLLRQHDHPSICKEIWWNYLTRTSQHSRTPVGTLPEDEYQASSHVCSVSSEPSGCSEPLNCTDRVVNFKQSILSIGQEIREARRRPLRIRDQQEGTKILQLVPGPTICRPERAAIQLVELEEPLLLPTLEPDFTGSPEGETRADYDDSNYASMDISNLVPGHANTIDLPTTNSTSNRGGPRPKKRKVPAHKEQGLDSNCVENQRSALEEKGVSNAAIELI